MEMPRTAIVILTWNNFEDTSRCLASISDLDYPSYVSIVVDNNSTDGSIERLQADFPACKFIRNRKNYGFAGGNNVGIKAALDMGCEFIWMINNDVVVETHALRKMVEHAEADPAVGIVGSKVYYFDDPGVLSFAGGLVNKWTGVGSHIGIGEVDEGQYDFPREVDYIIGCNLLIKRACVEDIGKLDESLFLYYEETDWAARAKQRGWKVFYVPVPGVWHRIGASSSQPSLAMSYYLSRNRLYFVKRNYPYHLPIALLASPRYCIVNHILKRRWKHLEMCLFAYRDFFLNRMGEAGLS
jgi:hypothetical protein